MRRLRHLAFGLAMTASVLAVPPSEAALPVIDASVLTQNVLEAARLLQQINNQITQINQFIQMLNYDARNIASLPFSVLAPLNTAIGQINSLLSAAQGIYYNITDINNKFAQFYPGSYAPGTPDAQLVADARTRWTYAVNSFQDTLRTQGQIVGDIPNDQGQMTALVNQSQGATGILQATQASNQILALQSKQLAATQALLASAARAQTLEQARTAEAEEQAQEQYRRFLGSPSVYTPIPVIAFH
ncbi:MAG TPA: P-type conjugative transfer protein TrbJ [Alphaproteobacteria bacterium]|nr:P-type conjugative transfer protein TrbJ [Alphaproteobacteria bacterium]